MISVVLSSKSRLQGVCGNITYTSLTRNWVKKNSTANKMSDVSEKASRWIWLKNSQVGVKKLTCLAWGVRNPTTRWIETACIKRVKAVVDVRSIKRTRHERQRRNALSVKNTWFIHLDLLLRKTLDHGAKVILMTVQELLRKLSSPN